MTPTIRTAIIASLVTTVLSMSLVGILVWTYRDAVVSQFIEGGGGVSRSPLVTESNSIVETVRNVNPAVVSISVTRNVSADRFAFDSPIREFFERFFNVPGVPHEEREVRVGGGSGFFVSSQGHIVTNRHVVADKDADYTVFLNDGSSFSAEIIAEDPFLDIAVIKISAGIVPYLRFASELPELGETVIAIGNALGEFNNTVSVGVVSGLSRSIIAGGGGRPESLEGVLQTDAAINPGNSGGPLVNLQGRVVGVNVAVAIESENIGFALPATKLDKVVESAIRQGRIIHPYLGVHYVPVTPALSQSENLPIEYGALIVSSNSPAILPGSPAAKAGLKEGDVIAELNGERITRSQPLSVLIQSHEVGEEVELVIYRDGQRMEVRVRLEEYRV